MSKALDVFEKIANTIRDLVESIGNALDSFGRNFWDGVTTVWRKVWKEILEPILQPIFVLLGIEDLTIVSSAVVTQPIFADEEHPSLTRLIRKSIFLQTNIADSIINHITTGRHIQLTSYFRSASTDFYAGLPTVLGTALVTDEPSIQIIIDNIAGEPTVIRTLNLESIDDTFYVEYYIWVEYNYRSVENILTYKGLEYNVAASSARYNPRSDVWELLIHPVIPDINDERIPITLAIPYFPITNYGYQVKYNLVSDSAGNLDYYFYELLKPEFLDPPDNLIPNPEYEATLEDIYVGANPDPDFSGNGVLPIVAVKEGGQYIDDKYGVNSVEYLSSKNLLRKVAINLETILDVLRDTSDPEANPDQIVDAFIAQGIDINSTTKAGQLYVFEVFLSLYYSSNISADGNTLVTDVEGTEYTLFNNFRVEEGNYNKIMTFKNITMRQISTPDTTIPDGTVTRTFSMTEKIEAKNCNEGGCPCIEWESNPPAMEDPMCLKYDDGGSPARSELVMTKKINFRHSVELTIVNLTAFSIIRHPEAPSEASMAMLNIMPVGEADNTETVSFLVPIIYSVVRNMNIFDQEDIIMESTHLVMYAALIQEIEWYKTPKFFKFLAFALIVARVVMAIISFGSSEYSGFGTVLYQIVMSYLILASAKYIITRMIESNPDSELAQALGVFIAVAALYYGSSDSVEALADKILLAISATSVVTDIYIGVQTDILTDKYEVLEETQDLINERDEEYAYLFEKPDGLAYYNRRTNIKVESVDTFFYRTLNAQPGEDLINLDNYLVLQLDLYEFK